MKKTSNVKEEMLIGIEDASKIVLSTMGPLGKRVAIKKDDGSLVMTKDGVTVAKNLQGLYARDSVFQEMGVQMMVDAANKTVQLAGDGTTTTCLLLNEILQLSPKDIDPYTFSRQLKTDADKAISFIKEKSVKTTKGNLDKIGFTAANNDKVLGGSISNLVWKVGARGTIKAMPQELGMSETTTEVKEGYTIERGMITPIFLGGHTHKVYEEPYVVLVEEKIESDYQVKCILQPYMDLCNKNKFRRPLVIFCSDIENQALRLIARNVLPPRPKAGEAPRRGWPIAVVKSPMMGKERYDMMDDLRVVVGCPRVFSQYSGSFIKEINEADFGIARSIVISENETAVFPMKLNKKEIKAQVATIKKISRKVSPFNEERISKLTSGIGIIYIGGVTDAETEAIKDQVEDTVRACQSAMKEGVVPGGGATLYYAGTLCEGVLGRALTKPFITLTGKDRPKMIGNQIGVYNILSKRWSAGKDIEIFNSVELLCSAIENAVSAASEILQANYGIYRSH